MAHTKIITVYYDYPECPDMPSFENSARVHMSMRIQPMNEKNAAMRMDCPWQPAEE